jgi:MFS family permease
MRYGKSWMTFWGTLACMVMNIWSAVMTERGDYTKFIVSRLFAGMTGASVSICKFYPLPQDVNPSAFLTSLTSKSVGPEFLVDIFFLHDRGKVFGIYFSCILLGIAMAPTFSGYITYYTSWTIQFWYQVAFLGASALAAFLFIEETGWDRTDEARWPQAPENWLAKRRLLYFNLRGFQVSPKEKTRDWVKPFRIFISPVVLLGGFVVMVTLGWMLALSTFIAIYLMTPVFAGGYGFNARQVANFTFCYWVGIFFSQVYAGAAYDRIPLFICKRFYNGVWHPELRLHSIWPVLIMYPIALGLFGEGLRQQWHYMSLAVFAAIAQFSGACVLPVMSNYMVEATGRMLAKEVNMAVSSDRLILGTASIFFLSPWGDATGILWVFGTMAFIQVFAGGIVLLLVLFGARIRQWNPIKNAQIEEGSVLQNNGGN